MVSGFAGAASQRRPRAQKGSKGAGFHRAGVESRDGLRPRSVVGSQRRRSSRAVLTSPTPSGELLAAISLAIRCAVASPHLPVVTSATTTTAIPQPKVTHRLAVSPLANALPGHDPSAVAREDRADDRNTERLSDLPGRRGGRRGDARLCTGHARDCGVGDRRVHETEPDADQGVSEEEARSDGRLAPSAKSKADADSAAPPITSDGRGPRLATR